MPNTSRASDSSEPTRVSGLLRYIAPLSTLAAFVALAIIGHNMQAQLEPKIDVTLLADPTCDLRRGPCSLALPEGGSVSLDIEPKSIPLLSPLKVTVTATDAELISVEVDFAGVDMHMGYNHVRLNRVMDNVFSGETTLPVCVRQRMDWEARVLLDTHKGRVLAPFLFFTLKGSAAS